MLWRTTPWLRTGSASSKGAVGAAVSNEVVEDFPGSPGVKTPCSQCKGKMQGARVGFLVRELRFCILHTMAKKKEHKQTNKGVKLRKG